MSDDNLEDISAELDRLREQRELLDQKFRELASRERAARQLKYEEEQKAKRIAEEEARKNIIVVINGIEVTGDIVQFKVDPRDSRQEIIDFLHKFPTYTWNGYYNSIHAGKWKEFSEQFLTLLNTKIDLSNKQRELVENWKHTPAYEVKIDDSSLTIYIGPGGSIWDINRLPGISGNTYYDSHLKRNYYRLPFAEAWRLVDALKDKIDVVWDEKALDFCNDHVSKRIQLDEIAKKLESHIKLILNGHTLHPYQNVFVEFASVNGFNLICADEMGIGKTPEFLALLTVLDEKYGPESKYLIIVPAAQLANWTRQIGKFLNSQAVYTMFGRDPSSVDMITVWKGAYKYYLCSYDSISTRYETKEEYKDAEGFMHTRDRIRRPWIELFNMADFKCIGLDEGHKIKNLDSNRSQAVRELNCPHKVILTGTPMINRPGELWPLVNWIDPKMLPGYDQFLQRYTYDKKTAKNVDELRQLLKPIMIRRVKKDIMKDLPPINRIDNYYKLTDAGRKAYQLVLDGFWKKLDEWGDDTDPEIITSLLAQLMKMKQVCAWDKIDYVADLASDVHESLKEAGGKHKVLIFTQFVNSPECVHEIALRLADQGVLEASGNDEVSERMEIVRQFQTDPSINFLVASTAAMGEGLDITEAGAVIFNDLMWTPAAHHQAEGRAYGRANDPHTIDSYYVMADDTIENDIYELLAAKINMFNEIIEGTEASRDTSVAVELLKRLKAMRYKR